METMIRASTLTGYFQIAHRHQLNALELLEQAGIDSTLIGDPAQRIPISAACALLEISAAHAACPTFGIEIAALRRREDVGAIGLLLAHKRTLREALFTAEKYRHLLNDALGLYVEVKDDMVIVREEIIATGTTQTRQATELAVGVLARICRALLGPDWQPRSVNFSHQAPADMTAHRRFFGCMVNFNSEFNGIVCSATDLDTPNPAADPLLVRYAETLAAPLNVSSQYSIGLEVRRAIYLLLPMNQATISGVADKLFLSPRTLQRHLNAADLDFCALLSDVRRDLAMRYLANPRFPMGRIAVLLGYSRQASFTRWFITRFGMTPSQWRTENREIP